METFEHTSAPRDTTGRVVPGPLRWSPPEPPDKKGWLLFGAPLLVLGLILFVVNQITLPYVQLAPGGADPINALVSVPKDKDNKPTGSFLLTTVSLESIVHPLDVVYDWFDPDIELIGKKLLLGDSSQQQYNSEAVQAMSDSKQAAVVLALRSLGYSVAEHGAGALILGVAEGSVPARGVFEAGDAITAIDGVATPLAADAVNILRTHQFGDTITTTVLKADDKTVDTKTVTLGSRTDTTCTTKEDTGAGACLGISLGTKRQKFDLPFEVKIDTAGIGGPSAGLAFTLAIIDELTPGELTGGKKVAVTGTIAVDGTVGEVGGVVQKTAAVRRSKATLFLVPPGEFADASKHAGKHLKVVKVSTLAEALKALADNGGQIPEKLASGGGT